MAKKITEQDARLLFAKNNLDPIVKFPGTQKPWKSKCLITGKIVSPTYGKVRDFDQKSVRHKRVAEKKTALIV